MPEWPSENDTSIIAVLFLDSYSSVFGPVHALYYFIQLESLLFDQMYSKVLNY